MCNELARKYAFFNLKSRTTTVQKSIIYIRNIAQIQSKGRNKLALLTPIQLNHKCKLIISVNMFMHVQ